MKLIFVLTFNHGVMGATDAQFFPSVSLSNGMRSVGLSSQLKLFLRTHVHASFHVWLHFLGFLCSVVAISTELLYAAYLTMTLHSWLEPWLERICPQTFSFSFSSVNCTVFFLSRTVKSLSKKFELTSVFFFKFSPHTFNLTERMPYLTS